MAKPWEDKPLWWKCYVGQHQKVYIMAGKIIGHLGIGGFAFYDAAKLLPCYDKLRFENAVRDLCVYSKREQGQYELTPQAKKVLRIIIGPAPDDPEYRRWWELRMISVRQMKEQGQPVEWAESPPVPIPGLTEEQPKKEPEVTEKPAKKPRKAPEKKPAKAKEPAKPRTRKKNPA